MKKAFGLFLALLALCKGAISQNNSGQNSRDYIQDPTFGVHFFFDDFKTAEAIRTTSLNSALKNKQFARFRNMSPGLALNYLEGLSRNFDLSATLAGSFAGFTMQNAVTVGDDKFLAEGDVSLRGKLFSNKYWFTPYVQAGVGGSSFQGYWGAFIPIGIGFQLNFFDEAFLLINSQYRIPVTETSAYHFYHSIGLAGTVGKRKSAAKMLPPPPLPQPAAPKGSVGNGIQ